MVNDQWLVIVYDWLMMVFNGNGQWWLMTAIYDGYGLYLFELVNATMDLKLMCSSSMCDVDLLLATVWSNKLKHCFNTISAEMISNQTRLELKIRWDMHTFWCFLPCNLKLRKFAKTKKNCPASISELPFTRVTLMITLPPAPPPEPSPPSTRGTASFRECNWLQT